MSSKVGEAGVGVYWYGENLCENLLSFCRVVFENVKFVLPSQEQVRYSVPSAYLYILRLTIWGGFHKQVML